MVHNDLNYTTTRSASLRAHVLVFQKYGVQFELIHVVWRQLHFAPQRRMIVSTLENNVPVRAMASSVKGRDPVRDRKHTIGMKDHPRHSFCIVGQRTEYVRVNWAHLNQILPRRVRKRMEVVLRDRLVVSTK